MASFLIPGSRFYLPRPYEGPTELLFKRLYGGHVLVNACEISCFELYKWPGVLQASVVMHLQNGVSHVLGETREEVEKQFSPTRRGLEPSL